MDKLFALFLKEKEYLENCTPRTIKFFQCSYKAFKRSGVTELNKQSLTDFVVYMRQRNLSAKSCNDYIAGMNSFFKWLYENQHIPEPLKITRMKEEKKVFRSFSDDELRKMINFKPKNFGQQRPYAILLTLIDTGCRIDELLTLTRENLDFDNLLMKVMGKGMNERIVPIRFELRKVLWKHLQKHGYNLVFASSVGTKTNYQNLWRDAQAFFRKLNISAEGFHCLRRTFARQYLKQGETLCTRLSETLFQFISTV